MCSLFLCSRPYSSMYKLVKIIFVEVVLACVCRDCIVKPKQRQYTTGNARLHSKKKNKTLTRLLLMGTWAPDERCLTIYPLATKLSNREPEWAPKTYDSQANFQWIINNKIPCSVCTLKRQRKTFDHRP